MNAPTTAIRERKKKRYQHTCFLCQSAFLSTKKRKLNFCPECLIPQMSQYHDAALKVLHNIRRAEKAGLPATLTVEQWVQTIDDFEWRCAYCMKAPYNCLEHFTPMELGGGTTIDNVLPACRSCNRHKLSYAPTQTLAPRVYHRLAAYLQLRKEVA